MKRTTSIIAVIGLLCLSAVAAEPTADSTLTSVQPVTLDTNTSPPTLSGPFIQVLGSLATATNWTIAPYGLYRTGSGTYGAGVAALYNLHANVATGVGIDYMDAKLWMPSAQVQLQLPLVIAGKVTVSPFGYSGISTLLSNGEDEDDADADIHEVVGIFGAGLALKLTGESSGRHLSAFWAMEKRTELDGDWMRFGLAYRF